MCLAVSKSCECGKNCVQFHLRDNVLPPAVIVRLFCPSCPGDQGFEAENMLNDNGWVIEYDMVLARSLLTGRQLLLPDQVNPEYIFDQGYCAWLETYPGEKEEIKKERDSILELRKTDQQRYLREMIAWNVKRIEELKKDGWRKACRA